MSDDTTSSPLFEMAERARQFRLVLDSIDLSISYYGRDLVIHFVNRQFADSVGLPEEKILGRKVVEVVGAAVFDDVREYLEQALAGLRVSYERDRTIPGVGIRRMRISLFPDASSAGEIRGMYALGYDIEVDHRLRTELRLRDEQLTRFADNIPEPIVYFDRQMRFLFANRAYLIYRDLREEDVTGRSVSEVRGEEAAALLAPRLERAFAGETVEFERRSMSAGGMRWSRTRLVPDRGSDGGVEGVYAVTTDIDGMKRAQQALADAESKIRVFTDRTPEPLAYFDADTRRFSFVNQAYLEGVRLPRNAVIGHTISNVLGEETAAYLEPYIREAREGRRTSYERLRPAADGTMRWIRGELVPDYDHDRKFKGIYLVVHDIHDMKMAQEALNAREAAIQHANWMLTSHIENTPMAVMEWNNELKLIRWSQRAEAVFGWAADEVLDSEMKDLHIVFSEDAPKVDILVQSLLRGERTSTTSMHRNLRKDGATIWCEWHTSALRGDDGRLLSLLSFAQDVSDRVDAQEKLEQMATHDALTGLPNRVLLQLHLAQTLDRARHRHRQIAVLFIDLDRFKNVNDSLGHRMGDELLRMIGRRLAQALRKDDFLARLGGDEFTVLLEDIDDADDAAQVARKLLDVIQQPYWVHGHTVHISASIGVAIFPDDGDDADTLLKNADVAMYRAKEAGKNVYQFFAVEMGKQQQQRMALETALRWAVKNQELAFKFQPKVEIATGRIVGAEALLRWTHPLLGDVPPSRFIPLAEESGLIDALGDWVLNQAFRESRKWAEAGLSDLTIAINLSVRQFRDVEFASRIQQIFAETGCDPRLVEFEVTETSVLYDAEMVSRVLQLEREQGVRVAIDDFGTGYSSLVHLKRLPIDILKIDQSFIRDITTDPDDKAITAGIIAMAHSLGLQVVAEAVETAEQLAFLTERGCDFYQGHLYSPPLESSAFIALALSRRSGADPALAVA